MKNLAKQTAHLISRNILSTAAVLTLMGVAAFAAAPVGGYQPGETLNPDCSPTDVDCKVVFTQAPNKFIDGTTATDAVFTGGNVGIGTDSPSKELDVVGSLRSLGSDGKGEAILESTVSASESIFQDGFGGLILANDIRKFYMSVGDDHNVSGSDTGTLNFYGWDSSNLNRHQFMSMSGNNGNVGISTAAPTARLEVATDGASGDAFKITDGTNTDMVVTQDGNVGIGTTSPRSTLEVDGSTIISGGNTTTKSHELFIERPGSSNVLGLGPNLRFDDKTLSNNNAIQNSLGALTFWNFSSGTSWRERMRISKEGNLGIGTTTPSAKLEVVGGAIKATGGLIIETRTDDPAAPVDGQIWLRTDI